VELTVERVKHAGAVTYRYRLVNHAKTHLHNFLVGTTLSSGSCPDLNLTPVGFDAEKNRCPSSIVVRPPWTGCVNGQEECYGGFLEFDYSDSTFDGLTPGDSLPFSVTVPAADSTYEHASFWIVGDDYLQYEGRARMIGAPHH